MLLGTAVFTKRARAVVAAASREAERRHATYVETEHLLLGLFAAGDSLATAVLHGLGVESRAVREAIETRVMHGTPESEMWARLTVFGPKYTARAKRALELAKAEALDLGHQYVGTEHLLLGLLRDPDSVAAQALAASGVDHAGAHRELLRLLGKPLSA
jgi:ATP-dependent Clp protease ATP-binding subunit ClpC